MELHDRPWPAPQEPHPALQPWAQLQGPAPTKLIQRQEHDKHHFATMPTALGVGVPCARTSIS